MILRKNLRKMLGSSLILPFLSSCNSLPIPFISPATNCPDRPDTVLKAEDVKEIDLEKNDWNQKVTLLENRASGYRFKARAGDRFEYSPKKSVCVWIFSPTQQMITDAPFPTDGNYLVHLSPRQGAGNFSLGFRLLSAGEIAAATPGDGTRIPADKAIENYYALLNRGQYETAWKQLAPNHRDDRRLHPDGYNSYLEWWQQVSAVDLQSTRVIESDDRTAIVELHCLYQLRSGKKIKQILQFFLSRNPADRSWQIEKTKRVSVERPVS